MGVGQKSGSTRWKPEVLVILGMNDPILRVIHQVWLILHYRTIGCRSIQLNELKTPIRNRVPRQFCCDVQLFMAWFVQTATGRPCLWVLVTSKLRGKLWIYMDFWISSRLLFLHRLLEDSFQRIISPFQRIIKQNTIKETTWSIAPAWSCWHHVFESGCFYLRGDIWVWLKMTGKPSKLSHC